MTDDEKPGYAKLMKQVGSLSVACPRCGIEITIPIHAGLVRDDEGSSKVYVRTSSDVDAYWVHYFEHSEGFI